MTQPDLPRFQLQRVADDGAASEPLVFAIDQAVERLATSRRGFLGTSLSTAALTAALASQTAHAEATGSRLLRAHSVGISDLGISYNGKWLVTAAGTTCKVWSMEQKKLLASHEAGSGAVTAVAFVGPTVATALADGSIELRDMESGKTLRRIAGHGARWMDMLGLDDVLVAAGSDGWVGFWSIPSGDVVEQVLEHSQAVRSLGLSASGRVLASGGDDGSIKVWALPRRTITHTLIGHKRPVTDVLITADEARLFSRSEDRVLNVWSLLSGSLVRTLEEPWNRADRLCMDRQGTLLATPQGKSIGLWTLPDGKTAGTLALHQAKVKALAISPDGEVLVSGDEDGVVIVWKLKTKRMVSYLYDAASNAKDRSGRSFEVRDAVTGRVVTYTLPCGAPIPKDAVCTCNCVPGTLPATVKVPTYVPRTAPIRVPTPQITAPIYVPRTGSMCSCDLICTCNLVFR